MLSKLLFILSDFNLYLYLTFGQAGPFELNDDVNFIESVKQKLKQRWKSLWRRRFYSNLPLLTLLQLSSKITFLGNRYAIFSLQRTLSISFHIARKFCSPFQWSSRRSPPRIHLDRFVPRPEGPTERSCSTAPDGERTPQGYQLRKQLEESRNLEERKKVQWILNINTYSIVTIA